MIKTVYPAYDKTKANALYNKIITCIHEEWKDKINETHLVQSVMSVTNIVLNGRSIKASLFCSKLCYDVLDRGNTNPTTTPLFESFGLQSKNNKWKLIFGIVLTIF